MKPLYLEFLIRLLYPETCTLCHKDLDLKRRHLCQDCHSQLKAQEFSWWDSPLEGSFGDLDHAWAIFNYQSPVKEILHQIKFNKKKWLSQIFSPSLGKLGLALTSTWNYDAIIPVPCDWLKWMHRQFNQAEIFAKALGTTTGLPVKSQSLKKRLGYRAQSTLNQKERLWNLDRAFYHPGKIKGKSFLLVDDIVTTAHTARQSAKALKKAGATRVDLIAIARAHKNVLTFSEN